MPDLLAPLDYAFFRQGLLVATLAGGLCGLLGVYVVLRGMSYIGHGLSHAILGGYAAAGVAGLGGLALLLGAGTWGVGTALAIGAVTRRRPIGADAAIGVVTTASFALGVALLTKFGSSGPSFDALLFGSILGVTPQDVVLVVAATVVAATVLLVRHRALLFATFDAEVAAVSGVRTGRLEALLMVVLSLAILATLTVIGVTLVAATLVIPAVVGRLLTDSFGRMVAISTAVGTGGGFVGMNLSWHVDVPSGTTIVLVEAVVFLAALVASGARRRRRLTGVDEHVDAVALEPVGVR